MFLDLSRGRFNLFNPLPYQLFQNEPLRLKPLNHRSIAHFRSFSVNVLSLVCDIRASGMLPRLPVWPARLLLQIMQLLLIWVVLLCRFLTCLHGKSDRSIPRY